MRHLTQGVQIHKGLLGTTTYFYMGKIHREDGPAVISPDHQMWMRGAKLHREDGPAFINIKEKKAFWYLYGKPIAYADFSQPNVDIKIFESYIHRGE